MEWISVKDRLPEIFKIVIVTDGKGVAAGAWQGGHHWLVRNAIRKVCKEEVTHWMPLPQVPKEDVE